MFSFTGSRAPARSVSGNPKLSIHGCSADGSIPLNADAAPKRFTLYRGHKERPLQFDGEVLAEAHTMGVSAVYRAAIYKTCNGSFVTEFSLVSMPQLIGGDPEREGRAAVLDSLDAACGWFRPGPLTTKLLRQLERARP